MSDHVQPEPGQPRRRGRPLGTARLAKSDILAAAEELFADLGVRRTTIADLATRCGVDRAAIYYHFGDKDAVLRAIGETVFGALGDALEKVRGIEPPEVRIAAYLLREHAVLQAHRQIVLDAYSTGWPDTPGHQGYLTNLARIDATLADWLAQAIASGGLSATDQQAAMNFVSTVALGALLVSGRDQPHFEDQLCLLLAALGAADPAETVSRASLGGPERSLLDHQGAEVAGANPPSP